jgi:RmlD substrate binding domain
MIQHGLPLTREKWISTNWGATPLSPRRAGHVAEAADRIGAPLLQLSTEYVFNGALNRPTARTIRPGWMSIGFLCRGGFVRPAIAGDVFAHSDLRRHRLAPTSLTLVTEREWRSPPGRNTLFRSGLMVARLFFAAGDVPIRCQSQTGAAAYPRGPCSCPSRPQVRSRRAIEAARSRFALSRAETASPTPTYMRRA